VRADLGVRVFDNVVGLVLAAFAAVYLTYAMLRPEKF
jgi:K+-transporting ATPase KdpF subunit